MTLTLTCYRCHAWPCECRDGQTIIHGDCREVLPLLEPVDAIVCDPPYGLEFMGKEWDKLGAHANARTIRAKEVTPLGEAHSTSAGPYLAAGVNKYVGGEQSQDWHHVWATAALAAAKPGAHLLALGGTRTHHRLTCALEDAGWEIRDCVMWVYGSGFPKSLDVSKAIDKAAGAEREVVGSRKLTGNAGVSTKEKGGTYAVGVPAGPSKDLQLTAPFTDAAKQWDGWGTALKPAWEPIIVARKPLDGTVAENVLKHGTGGINVDACRVTPTNDESGWSKSGSKASVNRSMGSDNYARDAKPDNPTGRFPANLIHDGSEEVVGLFPEAGGGFGKRSAGGNVYGGGKGYTTDFSETMQQVGFGDSGSAARFFYCAKASASDRGHLPAQELPLFGESFPEFRNTHPTVKPTELMRYLIRLVTPPGGVVLDPFAGSGSTLVAARAEGFDCIGIECEEKYCELAAHRLRQEVLL